MTFSTDLRRIALALGLLFPAIAAPRPAEAILLHCGALELSTVYTVVTPEGANSTVEYRSAMLNRAPSPVGVRVQAVRVPASLAVLRTGGVFLPAGRHGQISLITIRLPNPAGAGAPAAAAMVDYLDFACRTR
ncbi:hypothetical protein J8J14_03095 [Roseomonas sp. SSH11]|uniref:Uncharacterized protein n=1 Tax=Pararoseomonas baculiformis TaxID=2820812 RepID=A0ABS4AB30_9PROT|nr:hypothetical protein [Pararoseomonas baculiformis]MBP0443755.1 hypothetical protein [Pararoseomonas baculiformis]